MILQLLLRFATGKIKKSLEITNQKHANNVTLWHGTFVLE